MPGRYSPVQQLLHWITAALMFAILPVAWVTTSLKEDTPKFDFFLDVHKALGLTILALTLVRVVWRLAERPPPHPSSLPRWNRGMADFTLAALLVLMILTPVTGYLWTTGHGYDVAPFGVAFPRLFWNDRAIGDAAKAIHQAAQWAVYALIGLHLAGVAFHLMVRRDGLIARMLPQQSWHGR
jgi:cytochrome b561